MFVRSQALHHEQTLVRRLKHRLATIQPIVPVAVAPAPPVATPVASGSVRAFLLCIHPFEEPSWNTIDGGLGFINPPSAYPTTPNPQANATMAALANQYGDSWPSWPEEAQLSFAAALYSAYGTSPWSSAWHCS